MVKVVWNDTTIAESDETLVIEGNHYFPPGAVRQEYLRPSMMRSVCLWKGLARYYTLDVGGVRNVNAAWSYPQPWPWIKKIKRYVAFWNGVQIRP